MPMMVRILAFWRRRLEWVLVTTTLCKSMLLVGDWGLNNSPQAKPPVELAVMTEL